MQLDMVVSSDSKARVMASVARADARVLASDGRPIAGSDLKITVALESDPVVDKVVVVQVAQMVNGR